MMPETAYTLGQFYFFISSLATVIFQLSFYRLRIKAGDNSFSLPNVFCVCYEQNCRILDSTTNLKDYEKKNVRTKILFYFPLI